MSDWFLQLAKEDGETADQVEAAINMLEQHGPTLGRRIADRLKGSSIHNLKELRPPATSIRILFAFDPRRQAILLVAGDKSSAWKTWYDENIPIAETRFRAHGSQANTTRRMTMAGKARNWRDVRAAAHAAGLIDERRVAES